MGCFVGAEVVGLSVGDLVGFSYVEKKNCWGKMTFHIFKGNNKSSPNLQLVHV